jgi:hypothetical protein
MIKEPKMHKTHHRMTATDRRLIELRDMIREVRGLVRALLEGQGAIMAGLHIVNENVNTNEDKDYNMALLFDALKKEVLDARAGRESAKVFIAGLVEELRVAKSKMADPADQATIDALAADLEASEAAFADAIVTNPGGSTGGASAGGIGSTGGV